MDVDDEKTLRPIGTALYDNFMQQNSVGFGSDVNIIDDLNIISNTTDILSSFSEHDRVIFFDENLKLWKRGEIICYIEPEYKVSWGASWNWVNKNKLYRENNDNDQQIKQTNLQRRMSNMYSFNSYDLKIEDEEEIKEEQTAIIRAVNWSYFSDFFSKYLLDTLWKSVDIEETGHIDIENGLEPILHKLILIFFSKSGLINDKISEKITKPFVSILKESILTNLENNDNKISYEEFKHYSLWIPRSLKQMFQNGLIINTNELNEFLNRNLLFEVWDKFTKESAYSSSTTQTQVKNLLPIIHEIIIRFDCNNFCVFYVFLLPIFSVFFMNLCTT